MLQRLHWWIEARHQALKMSIAFYKAWRAQEAICVSTMSLEYEGGVVDAQEAIGIILGYADAWGWDQQDTLLQTELGASMQASAARGNGEVH